MTMRERGKKRSLLNSWLKITSRQKQRKRVACKNEIVKTPLHPTLCWISRGPRAGSNSCLYRLCFLDSVTQEELLEDENFLNDSGAGSKMHWDHSILKLRQNFSSLCGEQVGGRWEVWARKNTKSSKVHPNTFFCIRKVCKDHSTVHGSHDCRKSLAGQNQVWAMEST